LSCHSWIRVDIGFPRGSAFSLHENTENTLGNLAGLFVLFHLIEIPGKLGVVSGDFAFSWWMGKLAATLIGSVIAVALFCSAMSKQNDQCKKTKRTGASHFAQNEIRTSAAAGSHR